MPAEVNNIADVNLVARVVRHYGTDTLASLLRDRSTERNIIWASSEYERLGDGYEPYDEITVAKIADRHYGTIEPRVVKDVDKQAWRTKSKAEVFTPSWLCDKMVDRMDDAFFGEEPAAFGCDDAAAANPVERLGDGGRWKEYVDNRLLEITCGEAPFVCSPYDATTGDFLAVPERIGFLDRKLRVVTAFAADEGEWLKWAYRALESSYGYEYQGDNLLIARINVFNTLADHLRDRWGRRPTEREARRAALVVSWNFWQMDGLRGCAPSEWDVPEEEPAQMSLFDMADFTEDEPEPRQMQLAVPCRIFDWRARKPQTYESLKDTE